MVSKTSKRSTKFECFCDQLRKIIGQKIIRVAENNNNNQAIDCKSIQQRLRCSSTIFGKSCIHFVTDRQTNMTKLMVAFHNSPEHQDGTWAPLDYLGPPGLPFNGYNGNFPPDLRRRSVKFNIPFSTEVKNQWKHTSIPKQSTTGTTL